MFLEIKYINALNRILKNGECAAKKGGQEKNQKGHKKGHTVKGFKTSHQKDENTKTEEFYDEEHDEAGKAAFSGEHGEYGEKTKSEVGGKKEDKEYKAGEAKKDGQYANKVLMDKEKAEQGKYGKKKFAGEEAAYKLSKGGDAKEAGGHHEASKFSKHYPIVH